MLALPGTWEVLRAIGTHAARGLAAVEPRRWNRQAQRNAASAAAASRAWRLDAQDADHWYAWRHTAETGTPARPHTGADGHLFTRLSGRGRRH
jgi:GAF domain-containing protein